MDVEQSSPKRVKTRHRRNPKSCIYCRTSHQVCVDHPAQDNQPGQCANCIKRGWPCGPYETSGETIDFIVKRCPPRPTLEGHLVQPMGYLEDLSFQDFPLPNTAAFNPADVSRYSSFENRDGLDSQFRAEFLDQLHNSNNNSNDNGDEDHNDDVDAAKSPVARPLSEVHDTSRPSFQASDPLLDAQPDTALSSLPDPGDVHDLSKIFTRFRSYCTIRAHLCSQLRILSQQRLEQVNLRPSQAKEAVQILINEDFDKMKNLAFAAEDAREIDKARWMYLKLVSGLGHLENLPYEGSKVEESKMILLKAAKFYKRIGDHAEADRIIQKFFQLEGSMKNSISEMQKSSLFEEFLEKTLPLEIAFDSFTFANIFPPLHRIIMYSRRVPRSLFPATGNTGISMPKDFIGRTPLHVAAEKGDVELLQLFIEQGCSIEARDELGRTPLFLAASLGQDAAFEFLLSRGASLQVRDHASHFLMEVAARGNHTVIIQGLVDAKCDVNEKALGRLSGSRTLPALHAAAEKGHFEAVHLLIECGADPFTQAHDTRKTAEQLARDHNFTYVADFLKRKRISLGKTPMDKPLI